jgi:hypothetical protein
MQGLAEIAAVWSVSGLTDAGGINTTCREIDANRRRSVNANSWPNPFHWHPFAVPNHRRQRFGGGIINHCPADLTG